jgi:hypothetical protein
MAEFLLTSEKFVKEVSSISDNVAGKYIQPSIREAQEVWLKSIIGSTLLNYIKALGLAKTLDDPANVAYKELVDRAQYFLAYTAIVEMTNKVSYKIGNFGVTKTTDENLQVATQDEIAKMQYYYQSKADFCALELQQWILDNRTLFPELDDCTCRKIHSNLHSAASCGLWFGGARGKMSNPKCCKR